jgi:hypothetical protein
VILPLPGKWRKDASGGLLCASGDDGGMEENPYRAPLEDSRRAAKRTWPTRWTWRLTLVLCSGLLYVAATGVLVGLHFMSKKLPPLYLFGALCTGAVVGAAIVSFLRESR